MIHKLKLITLLLGITTAATATVRTVNNNGGAQYATIETAVAASAIGDTVYVCGSTTNYTPPTTRKNNMVFIGAGFNPQKQNPIKSTLSGGTFNVGNNNFLIGLELQSQVNYLDGCTGLTLDRCYGQNNINSNGNFIVTNFTMSNCIWLNILFISNKIVNGLITNTIFYTSTNQVVFNNMQAPGYMLIDRCTFIAAGAATNVFTNAPVAGGFTFNNNVFANYYPFYNTNYTFNYNVAPFAYAGTGNLGSTAWPFNQAQAGVTGAYNYAWDFTILTASVAHNSSADGTDMGVYGGLTPFNWDGEPAIPQMDIMTTTGTQFTSGGNMQINFQSSVQD